MLLVLTLVASVCAAATAQQTTPAPTPPVEARVAESSLTREDTLNVLTATLAGIALLQLFVFGWQGWQMRRTVSSFVNKERAFMVIGDVGHNIPTLGRGPEALKGLLPAVGHQYVNVGMTTALVESIRLDIHIGEELPSPPVFKQFPKIVTYGHSTVRPDADTWYPITQSESPITEEQARSLCNGTSLIFTIGAITYKDVFEVTRTRVFARKFKGHEFVPSGGKAYNFERKGEYKF